MLSSSEELINEKFDMFKDITNKNQEWMKEILKKDHIKFINHVEQYRGDKIKVIIIKISKCLILLGALKRTI